MSDEEDYSSADDEDYVPSDKEGLSEEDDSGEEEDLAVLNEGGTSENRIVGKRKRKKAKNEFASRKRKGGIKLDGDECGEEAGKEEQEDIANKQLKEDMAKEAEAAKEDKEKKKADDLWSSFMSDVGRKPKPAPTVAPSGGGLGALTSVQPKKPESAPNGSSQPTKPGCTSTSATTQKITVTKVFDFAGEEVKIKEEVDIQSKEGQKELKRLEEESGSGDNTASSDTDSKPIQAQVLGRGLPFAGKSSPKPAGGLGSVLGKIGKKNKLSALTKSKLDWDSYKKEEGIEEDLKIHNRGKDGYVERMQFLQRTDVRQFEIEKSLRQTSSKR